MNKHRCPHCGAPLEAYRDGNMVIIKCDECGKVISEHSYMQDTSSAVKAVFPTIIGMMLFAVTSGVTFRIISILLFL